MTAGQDAPPASSSGPIDTLGAALTAVLARPVLAVVPLLADLALWLGVRVSPQPLTDPLGRWLTRRGGDGSGTVRADLDRLGADGDLVDLAFALVPSLLRGADRDGSGMVWERPIVTAPGWFGTALAIAGLLLLAVALRAAVQAPLAALVRRDGWYGRRLVRQTALGWVRLLGLGLLLVGIAALVLGPILVLAIATEVVGIDALPLLLLLSVAPLVWATVHFFFAPEAIFVGGAGPLRALGLSFRLVRRDRRRAVLFQGLALLLGFGLIAAWRTLLGSPPGVLTAIAGHALLATGLLLARSVFYRDRAGPDFAARSPSPVSRSPGGFHA